MLLSRGKFLLHVYALLAGLFFCSSFGMPLAVLQAQTTTPQLSPEPTDTLSNSATPTSSKPTTNTPPPALMPSATPAVSTSSATTSGPATVRPKKIIKPIGSTTVTRPTSTLATTSTSTKLFKPVSPAQSELGIANTMGGTANPFGGGMYATAILFFVGAMGFIAYGVRLLRGKKKKEALKFLAVAGPCDSLKISLDQKSSQAAAVLSHISMQEKLAQSLSQKMHESLDYANARAKTDIKIKIVEGVKLKISESDTVDFNDTKAPQDELQKELYEETQNKLIHSEKLLESLKVTHQALVAEQVDLEGAYRRCLSNSKDTSMVKTIDESEMRTPVPLHANLNIGKTIKINAPAKNVWRVFADSSVSRKMGGAYVTDWKVCSPFGWKSVSGQMYTRGYILDITPERYLSHTLLIEDDAEKSELLYSTISYTLTEIDDITQLHVQEEFATVIDEEELAEVKKTWDVALRKVREIAEGLPK